MAHAVSAKVHALENLLIVIGLMSVHLSPMPVAGRFCDFSIGEDWNS